MQPSMFNVRVPLEDRRRRVPDEHVHGRAVDRRRATWRPCSTASVRSPASAALDDEEREALSTLAEHGFIVDDREADRRNIEDFFRDVRESTRPAPRDRAHDAAVQFRLRLLHPGGSRRLQQARREDVARDRRARRRLDRGRGSTRLTPESFVLTFFGGEPLLNLPVVYYLAERLWHACAGARRADADQRHHQRPAADAGGGRSPARRSASTA